MALSIYKSWGTEEFLFSADLTASFSHLVNNALSMISPLTGNLDFDGHGIQNLAMGSASAPSLYVTGASTTGLYFSTTTVNATTVGVQAASFGASWILRAAPEDSRTATVDVAGIIESTTSGTPAAGIGTGLQFNCESQDENPSVFGRLDFAASDIGTGTEDTYFDVLTRVAGAAAVTTYRFGATGAFKAIFTHANSADHTYTLQNSDDVLVGRDTSDTLTNKTLTSPTINGGTLTGVTGTPYTIVKTANETVNDSSTLQNDNDLVFAIAASKNYAFTLTLLVTSASANADVKIGWTVPASCTMTWAASYGYTSAGVSSAANSVWAAPDANAVAVAMLTEGSTPSFGAGAFTHGVVYHGTIINSTNAGNVQFQWAQASATAEDTIVLKNSRIQVTLLQ